MKWARSLNTVGRSKNVNLPNALTRALGWKARDLLIVEWTPGEETVRLSRLTDQQLIRQQSHGVPPLLAPEEPPQA